MGAALMRLEAGALEGPVLGTRGRRGGGGSPLLVALRADTMEDAFDGARVKATGESSTSFAVLGRRGRVVGTPSVRARRESAREIRGGPVSREARVLERERAGEKLPAGEGPSGL